MVDWRPPSEPGSESTPMNIPQRQASTSTQGRRRHRSDSGSERHHNSDDHPKILKLLSATTKQLEIQQLRTAEAERELFQLLDHFKRVNNERLAALQEAAKAREELKLYKIQLEHAQHEIYRAQNVLDEVDRQRDEAEKNATQAKAMARKLNQSILIKAALEEGKRLGMQEGLERGRTFGYDEVEYNNMNNDEGQYYDEHESLERGDIDNRTRSLLMASTEDIQHTHYPVLPDPIQVPPPEPTQPEHDTRQVPFRGHSPSVHHVPISIPPEGYIPSLDADNVIRIPPPHELSRPPPTPERMASPSLPQVYTPEEPIHLPRSHQGHQRNTSLDSTSSIVSQLDSFNGLGQLTGRQSPLNVISNVHSHLSTANPELPGRNELGHQPSRSGSSLRSSRSNGVDPRKTPRSKPPIDEPNLQSSGSTHRHPSIGTDPRQTPRSGPPSIRERPNIPSSRSLHRHSSTGSNASRSLHPLSAVPEDRPKSSSSFSTVPGISVLPPSRPVSFSTPQSQHTTVGNLAANTPRSPKPRSISRQHFSAPIHVDPDHATPEHESMHSHIAGPMPGAYEERLSQTPWPVAERQSIHGGNELEDDAVSSTASDVTLTTPPGRHSRRHLESQQELGWESAVRSAGSPMPMPFDSQPLRESRRVSRGADQGQ